MTWLCLIWVQERIFLKSLLIRATVLSDSQALDCSHANGSFAIFRDLMKSTMTHMPKCVISMSLAKSW